MSKTVLVVDDSDMVRKILKFTLKSSGYNILISEDGKEALKHFDGKNIDLMITDLHMPEKDGITLINEVRQIKNYRFMPVILFHSLPTDVKAIIEKSKATILFDKNSISEQLMPTINKLIA
ncbi:MAG TPA: response regulator [Pedobacter sp.]|jgi:two-component system chemotaxis response regulator CheY